MFGCWPSPAIAECSHWHNLLDPTYGKKIWANTQPAKLLQGLGEPGFLPCTLGCLCHLVISLPVHVEAHAAFWKHYLGSGWITATLGICTGVRLPKHQGLHRTVRDLLGTPSVGFSLLPLHLHAVNIRVLQFTHHWEAQFSFQPTTSCKATPWKELLWFTFPSSGNGHSSMKQLKIWLHLTVVLSEITMRLTRGCQLDCSGGLYL